MKYFFWLIFFPIGSLIYAQQITIHGYVYDMNNGESIGGAQIEADAGLMRTQTNAYGYYSLSLPQGTQLISWIAEGYLPEQQEISLSESVRKDIFLMPEGNVQLDDVIVEARLQNKIKDTQMGLEKVKVSTLNKLPVLLGERDIIKTMKFLPGLKSSGAGQSGLSVRGGGTGQNMITLDDAIVYNTDHLLGFFSTFNSDAIKDVSLYKGTAPAEYGGRVASFMDVRMKDGNNKYWETSGGIGLISSRLNVEGPIQQNKSSFLITGRRSYADLFLKLTDKFKDNKLFFYDLNAKLNYKIDEKNQIFLSGYYGRDVLGLSDRFGISWGNVTQTLRYNRIWNDRLFSNTSLVYSNFDFQIDIKSTDPEFSIISKIQDFNLKHEFQYFPNVKNNWKFGVSSTHHSNVPGGIDGLRQLAYSNESRNALETATYISNDWKMSEKFSVQYGLRLNHFMILPGGEYYKFAPNGDVIETIEKARDIDDFWNLEPRLSISYRIDRNRALKSSYTRNTQNMHLISNSIASSPSDRWIMSSNLIKPQISDQISVGYFQDFLANTYELSVETYYKDMKNQIDFKDAADDRDLKIERQLRFGVGRAYGIELLARKNKGDFTGWLSYTWSKTEKRIDGVNNDDWYFARQDRPHDLALVGMYELNEKWNFSASFLYQTGKSVTYPTGRYEIDGQTAFYYTERNGYRLPDNHRLDIAATWTLKKTKKRLSELVFSIFNVYGRENAYTVYFEEREDNPNAIKATQISLFKYMPSISYNFKF